MIEMPGEVVHMYTFLSCILLFCICFCGHWSASVLVSPCHFCAILSCGTHHFHIIYGLSLWFGFGLDIRETGQI